jgi:hypothetical protein
VDSFPASAIRLSLWAVHQKEECSGTPGGSNESIGINNIPTAF